MEASARSPAIPSGVFIHPMSIMMSDRNSLMLSKPASPDGKFEFQDHYAVLELRDMWATSEEIKQAFRRLREEAFRTDGTKYRALQAAYEVLVDMDSRLKYDNIYRAGRGLPLRPPPVANAARTGSESSSSPSNSSQSNKSSSSTGASVSQAAASSPTMDTPLQSENDKSTDSSRSRQKSALPVARTSNKPNDRAPSPPRSRLPVARTPNRRAG